MKFSLEHALNHWVLLAANILIVIIVEATGTFFAMNGLIHLIAVFFVAIGLTRIWTHRDVYDHFLQPLIHFSIFALVILALSHVVEYFSFRSPMLTHETIVANVVNAYLIAFLIIIAGTENFLRRLHTQYRTIMFVAFVSIAIFSSLFVLFLIAPQLIQLQEMSWALYGYLFFILLISIFCIWRLSLLKNHVPMMKNFVNYFIAAIVLICSVALFSILEELITTIGVPFIQIIYINHFLFYGALSLMFLAYEQVMHLKGLYSDLEKVNQAKETVA